MSYFKKIKGNKIVPSTLKVILLDEDNYTQHTLIEGFEVKELLMDDSRAVILVKKRK